MSPGKITIPFASISNSARDSRLTSDDLPTFEILESSVRMPPSVITRLRASIVTRVPPVTSIELTAQSRSKLHLARFIILPVYFLERWYVLMRHHFAKRILAVVVLIAVFSVGILMLYNFHELAYPRRLEVGDKWSYAVVFPDSHEYVLTETVQTRLSNDTYLIFRDDDQHLSTGYLWLTSSWYETGESRTQIGNLEGNTYSTYNPPIELVRIPLRVGDEWEVDSNLTTRTTIRNQTRIDVSVLHQLRETSSEGLIHTPIGSFQSFMINVFTGPSLYETLWFNVELGQVVYAKFYNSLGESVTETLVGYNLAPKSVEGFELRSLKWYPTEVLCTSRPTLTVELKNLYG